jgi:DNA-binding GntR family transcriptional regulator
VSDSLGSTYVGVLECDVLLGAVDSLKHKRAIIRPIVNRLRRLVEYRQAVNRERAYDLCVEHIELIDLLLAGENEAAETFLRQHLMTARRAKTRDSDQLLHRVAASD